MKSKIQLHVLAAILFFIASLAVSWGQNPFAPAGGAPGGYGFGGMPAIDPATGLPLVQPVNPWIDPNWKDPVKVLTNVFFDGLPVSEIARNLGAQFKDEFDILLPQGFGATPQSMEGMEWIATPVHLRLREVKASEVFNAMNLLFENNRTPLRWELKMNGSRRIALLRVLADPKPADVSSQDPFRQIFFVGHLIGEKNGGMSMKKVVETVTELSTMSGSRGRIQFHDEAQLVIITGTTVEIDFVEQTLKALTQKMGLASAIARQQAAEAKPNPQLPINSDLHE